MNKIKKSSRHSKTIGEFGENLVVNWLSRTGFEVARVDHTGIDIIAYDPTIKKRYAISVKSRTRYKGTESDSVNILLDEKDEEKLLEASKAFGGEPWIAVYSEAQNFADLYLCPYEHFKQNYFGNLEYSKSQKVCIWMMNENAREMYSKDDEVLHIRFDITVEKWFEA